MQPTDLGAQAVEQAHRTDRIVRSLASAAESGTAAGEVLEASGELTHMVGVLRSEVSAVLRAVREG